MNAKAVLACVVVVQCVYGLSAAPFLRTSFANVEYPSACASPFNFANEFGYGPFGTAFGYEGPFGFGTTFGCERPFGYGGFAGPFNAPFERFTGPCACGPNAFAFEGFNGPFAYEGFTGPFNYAPFPYTPAIF
ncbi:uncharacterized protein YmaG-like [Aricia agestis]|uniref:uncharacterized protein YmaG-like n=1 Tax=Aricia agestis TaxID=91739 RepID=UPI001C2071DB|nr:uncharacterized protein YmaG-like [Aricia agestis]